MTFALPCLAELENDDPDLGDFIESAPVLEDAVIIPSFPKADDLLEVDVDRADMPFKFYLDSKSLLTAAGLGVIRYTVVVESDSGVRNVFFEGIRCQTREFRAYAYGTYDNKLVKATISEWKTIPNDGSMAHRYSFYRHYMCSKYLTPNSADVILEKIKYPENFQESYE